MKNDNEPTVMLMNLPLTIEFNVPVVTMTEDLTDKSKMDVRVEFPDGIVKSIGIAESLPMTDDIRLAIKSEVTKILAKAIA